MAMGSRECLLPVTSFVAECSHRVKHGAGEDLVDTRPLVAAAGVATVLEGVGGGSLLLKGYQIRGSSTKYTPTSSQQDKYAKSV